MAADAHAAADFYGTGRGAVTARLLRQRLASLWPDLTGQAVLGLGYAQPYLRLWREQADRCIAVTPAQMGAARWPAGVANLSCTAEEDALPFPDLMFDRILLVHGLEAADNARRLLRELWRVLKDDGRLLIVAPNRSGLWAYFESTPFGHGQPVLVRPDRAAADQFHVSRRAARDGALHAAQQPTGNPAQRPAPGAGGAPLGAGARRSDDHRSPQGRLRRHAGESDPATPVGARRSGMTGEAALAISRL